MDSHVPTENNEHHTWVKTQPGKPKVHLASNQKSGRDRRWLAVRLCNEADSTDGFMTTGGGGGGDLHILPAGTDSTSGPGKHRLWEQAHWSITRCRCALATGSHKARPRTPTSEGPQRAPPNDFELVSAAPQRVELARQINIWAESWGVGLC